MDGFLRDGAGACVRAVARGRKTEGGRVAGGVGRPALRAALYRRTVVKPGEVELAPDPSRSPNGVGCKERQSRPSPCRGSYDGSGQDMESFDRELMGRASVGSEIHQIYGN